MRYIKRERGEFEFPGAMEKNAFVFYNPSLPPPPLPGSIPSLYREVYDTVAIGSKIPKALWMRVIATGHVSESAAVEASSVS